MQLERLAHGITVIRNAFSPQPYPSMKTLGRLLADRELTRDRFSGDQRLTMVEGGRNIPIPDGLVDRSSIQSHLEARYAAGAKIMIGSIDADAAQALAASIPQLGNVLTPVRTALERTHIDGLGEPGQQVRLHAFLGGGPASRGMTRGFSAHCDSGIGSIITGISGWPQWSLGQRVVDRPLCEAFVDLVGPPISLRLEPGTVMFLPPGVVHRIDAHSDDVPSFHAAAGDLYNSLVLDRFPELFRFISQEHLVSDNQIQQALSTFLANSDHAARGLGLTERREVLAMALHHHLLAIDNYRPVVAWLDENLPTVFDAPDRLEELARQIGNSFQSSVESE